MKRYIVDFAMGFAWVILDARDEQDGLSTVVNLKSVHKRLQPGPCVGTLKLDPASNIVFDFGPSLEGHANGMVLMATDAQDDVAPWKVSNRRM